MGGEGGTCLIVVMTVVTVGVLVVVRVVDLVWVSDFVVVREMVESTVLVTVEETVLVAGQCQ